MKHYSMKNVEKSNFTSMFTGYGGVFENFKNGIQGWLVPNQNRPGDRVVHLFQCTGPNWQYCEIKTVDQIKDLELSQTIKEAVRTGINPVLPKELYTNYLLQDMLYKAEDRRKSIIYGFFLLPEEWRSHGELQLFYRKQHSGPWTYLRNYKDESDILADKKLPNNVRQQIRKQVCRKTA